MGENDNNNSGYSGHGLKEAFTHVLGCVKEENMKRKKMKEKE